MAARTIVTIYDDLDNSVGCEHSVLCLPGHEL